MKPTMDEIDQMIKEQGLHDKTDQNIKDFLATRFDEKTIYAYLDYRYLHSNSLFKEPTPLEKNFRIIFMYIIGIALLVFHFHMVSSEYWSKWRNENHFFTFIIYGLIKYASLFAGIVIPLAMTIVLVIRNRKKEKEEE